MSNTLVMVNPYAGGGQALDAWQRSAPLLTPHFDSLHVVVTRHMEAIAEHVTSAYADGIRQILGVGGDGTNFTLLNALIPFNQQHGQASPLTYATLPVGTGCDWARSRGIPRNPTDAARWLVNSSSQRVDIGQLVIDGAAPRYFLNIASTGLGGEVDARVNRVQQRRPWTFLRATVAAILSYTPQTVSVQLDGADWFHGESLLVVVANGTTFGHGMRIAPDAQPNDGLFDVLVLRGVARPTVLAALGSVYTGSHLSHPAITYSRARHVTIHAHDGPLGLDLDGEYLSGTHLKFNIQPGALSLRG